MNCRNQPCRVELDGTGWVFLTGTPPHAFTLCGRCASLFERACPERFQRVGTLAEVLGQ